MRRGAASSSTSASAVLFLLDVAEKAMAQDLPCHVISSDLQQFNVTSPVYSLANVMKRLHAGSAPVARK